MTLTSGLRLGSYEIDVAIGAGGMGEVFRARDATLNRDVAIKVLPAAMASDPERLARFKREAQVLASLNHSNIAQVYAFEGVTLPDGSTVHFLAMELVLGEDLADRLKRSAIPIDEAIVIAKQIAEGLEDAHEHGIIHRDLKPANIKLTPDGRVKVLDFGLAKALEGDPLTSGANSQLSHSPTMSRHATEAGMIMGTAAYMSPEQARGKAVDKRADIWSFGVVLFEMLTGERLFRGETVSDVLAAVLTRDPNMTALPSATPGPVRQLLRRCLERDPKKRLRDIGDARLALDDHDSTNAEGTPTAPRNRWTIAAAITLGSLGVLAAFASGFAAGRANQASSRAAARFEIVLPEGVRLTDIVQGAIAISPDGRALVLSATDGSIVRLYVRWLDRTDLKPIPGTEDGRDPFFSPDGRSVGFFAKGQLKKASLVNDTVLAVAASEDSTGASWGPDGTIVFAPGYSSGLVRVSAAGGDVRPLTTRDTAAGEASHAWPDVLPDGENVLFTIEYTGKPFDEAAIAVVSLRTGKSRVVLRGGTSARYSPSGHLLYTRGNRLLAVPFDLGRIEVTGEATTVQSGVATEVGRGRAHYAISSAGAFAFAPGDYNENTRQLSWATREGVLTPASALNRGFDEFEISPDGWQVLFQVTGSDDDLWLLDLSRDVPTRLTFGTENASPVWAPDGKRFVWASDRNGDFNLYLSSVDSPTSVERLTTSPARQMPGNWAPKAGQIIYSQEDTATRGDIWALEVDAERRPREIVKTAFDERSPVLSPDGRWLAYTSDESGRLEVYVQAFPGPGTKRQVSDRSGMKALPHLRYSTVHGMLRWSRDGRELFYLDGGRLMAVSIESAGRLASGRPRLLFDLPDVRDFDVAPDGKRFLLVRELKSLPLTRIVVALDGASEFGAPQAARRQ